MKYTFFTPEDFYCEREGIFDLGYTAAHESAEIANAKIKPLLEEIEVLKARIEALTDFPDWLE